MVDLGLGVEVIEASLFRLPFRPEAFDRIFSLGVLQHTPDPKAAIRLLPRFLKPGGSFASWIYEKRWTARVMPRSYLRALTRTLPIRVTFFSSLVLVAALFPFTMLLSRIPVVRKALPLVPIASRHYWGRLSLRQQWEWTLLDTFDSYASTYELNQTEHEVISALGEAGMVDIRRLPTPGMAIVAVKSPPAHASF